MTKKLERAELALCAIPVRNPVTGLTTWIDPERVTQGKLDAMPLDNEVRELVHSEMAPCSPAEFFRAYAERVGTDEAGIAWFWG